MRTGRRPSRLASIFSVGVLLSLAVITESSPAQAALPCPCTIWDNSATPAIASVSDPNAVELGVRFHSSISGFITGFRFYKGAANTGTHIGHLWSNSGLLLATETFTGESASGWQQVALSSPVAIAANTPYVASYFAPNGAYAATRPYFDAGPFDNPPLTALVDGGVDGANGVYVYSETGGFPTETFASTNYWVDVVFDTILHRPSLPALVTNSTTWTLGQSLTDSPSFTTANFGARPLVPLTGDWDGNGSKTPGFFKGGAFMLTNSTGPTPTVDVTFSFGDARGFPVAGDFNGDGIDDVAVYKAGVWQVRYSTGVTVGPFTLGAPFATTNWPNTVPVAGDWDGDGIAGIGTYTYATGTWALRNTATAGSPDFAPFVYWAGSGSYPVVGDWDNNGSDTVGVKNGVGWHLSNSNQVPADQVTFNFGGSNDLPLAWSTQYGTP